MPQLINLIVNSRHSEFLSDTPSAFTYKIVNFINKPRRLYVESVQLYNSQYTINSFNNRLHWKDSTGTLRISLLTRGYYSATGLATHIQTVMNTDNGGSGTFTVSFSTSTDRFTFSNSSANFELLFGTFRATNDATAISLGFRVEDKTGASSYTSDFMPALSSRFFSIRTNIFTNNFFSKKGQGSVIAVVPNDTSFGEMNSFKSHHQNWIDVDDTLDLSRMKFEVRDDKNNSAELNAHWTMHIVLEIE